MVDMHENSPERKRGALSVISTLYCIKSQRNLIGPCYGMYCNAQANCCLFSDLIKSLCCRHWLPQFWPFLDQFIAWQLYLQPRAIIVIGGFLVLPSQPSKNAASRPSDTIYSASILQNVCIHVNAKISPWCESNPHKCKKCTLVWITSHLDGKVDVQLEVQP